MLKTVDLQKYFLFININIITQNPFQFKFYKFLTAHWPHRPARSSSWGKSCCSWIHLCKSHSSDDPNDGYGSRRHPTSSSSSSPTDQTRISAARFYRFDKFCGRTHRPSCKPSWGSGKSSGNWQTPRTWLTSRAAETRTPLAQSSAHRSYRRMHLSRSSWPDDTWGDSWWASAPPRDCWSLGIWQSTPTSDPAGYSWSLTTTRESSISL